MYDLPKLIDRKTISERLLIIFPEGTPHRNYCIREQAASTIFTMLYVGAIENTKTYILPKHVYWMTDVQAEKSSDTDRMEYYWNVIKPGNTVMGNRWYTDNTRESIRDETIRQGFIPLGVVIENKALPTTSSKPRYTLQQDFAALFNPDLTGERLEEAITKWQATYLSTSALARIRIIRSGALAPQSGVLVTFPNGETRHMKHGPSTHISKAVIEEFAPRFLVSPFVLWLSESGNKVVQRDDRLANELNIVIDPSRHLPDIILVDIGDSDGDVFFYFVEVVATDGAITNQRKDAFFEIIDKGGYSRDQVSFITAYADRQSSGFKRTISEVAWNSFIWFASEPDNLMILEEACGKLALRKGRSFS